MCGKQRPPSAVRAWRVWLTGLRSIILVDLLSTSIYFVLGTYKSLQTSLQAPEGEAPELSQNTKSNRTNRKRK